MWIRSQDRKILIKTSFIFVNDDPEETEECCTCEDCGQEYSLPNTIGASVDGEMVLLGIYETHERCLSILDGIHNSFDIGLSNSIYQMPED